MIVSNQLHRSRPTKLLPAVPPTGITFTPYDKISIFFQVEFKFVEEKVSVRIQLLLDRRISIFIRFGISFCHMVNYELSNSSIPKCQL